MELLRYSGTHIRSVAKASAVIECRRKPPELMMRGEVRGGFFPWKTPIPRESPEDAVIERHHADDEVLSLVVALGAE